MRVSEPTHRRRGPGRPEDRGERALRGLVGAGPTQLSTMRAARARDVARPSAEELTAAAASLVVVRRGYRPPAGGSSPVRS